MENFNSEKNPGGIESTLKDVALYNKEAFVKLDERLAYFLTRFNQEFPVKYFLRKFAAEAVIFMQFREILSLYGFGNSGAVIIELHAMLEKSAMMQLPKMLGKDDKSEKVIELLFEKKNLIDIAPIFLSYGIWSAEDIKFISKLSKIRNGIAHKNAKLISNALNDGEEMHFLDIRYLLEEYDTIEHIMSTLIIMMKIFEYTSPDTFLLISQSSAPPATDNTSSAGEIESCVS